jgi:cytochrome c556
VRPFPCWCLLVIPLALAGCARSPPANPRTSPFLPRASIREIMDAEVDPAADALWDSVGVTVTASGEEDKQPRTAEEWKAVRRSAITLVEATNVLMMEGRRATPPDAQPGPGELSPAVIQRRIDANRAAFVGFAQELRDASLKALDAIDAQDPERLMNAGGEIDQACEACHLVYWYPPDASKSLRHLRQEQGRVAGSIRPRNVSFVRHGAPPYSPYKPSHKIHRPA